jgi:hypothetical protein
MRRRTHLLPALICACTAILLISSTVNASDMRAGENIRLAKGETVNGNFYTAGGDVEIAGDVTGDLLVIGGRVAVPGNVAHDVASMGGELDITGQVGGDVRIAGGEVIVGGEVNGDLVIAGGTVRLLSGAVINGDVMLAGSDLRIEGLINGSLIGAANLTRIEGTIQGPVRIRTALLEFGERANLGNSLSYLAPQEADIPPTAQITGPIQFEMTSGMDQSWLYGVFRKVGIAIFLFSFGIALAGGLLAVNLFPQTSTALVQHISSHLGIEFLRGFVLFLVMPPIFFLLMVTVIGMPVAVLTGMIHLVLGVVSVIYAAVLAGALFLKAVRHIEAPVANWKAVMVGIPLLFFVSLIPVLGFLVNTALFLAVFGGLYGSVWRLVRREQPTPPPEGI